MFEEYKIEAAAKDAILNGIEYVIVKFENMDISNKDEVLTTLGRALGTLRFIKSELERAERV